MRDHSRGSRARTSTEVRAFSLVRPVPSIPGTAYNVDVHPVIIHGHFYQPPRESPWTERIGREPTAAPFHNWNARIQRECYGPNRAARILDGEKRITAIVNNYARISFNFGPTLLDWMVRNDPVTLEALAEADRESRRRLGHGNALAQGYNHAILPLLDRRDKVTQVRWGMAHFRAFFGREPEGMWLPETAADLESLDVLAEAGIGFTVLAPWQMTELRPGGRPDTPWRKPAGSPDLGRAYRCRTSERRSINLFFYDGDIARDVAFGKLLESGDAFAGRLAGSAAARPEGAPLLSIATDGETYGHHHRFGEMALAYALDRLASSDRVEILNYATYLERQPPAWEARVLEPGSWSCVHGVERWRSDCGCSTGGKPEWNQKWRTPLFEALGELRGALAGRFEEEGGRLLRDPWAARDDYIEVLLDPGPERRRRFLDSHARAGDPRAVWRLLEMERHALLMFTSCGWFFNDLAGIETLQVLRYAGRALELYAGSGDDGVRERFLKILSGAHTNAEPVRSGADLFESVVLGSRVDPPQVAAQAVLAKRLGLGRGEVPDPPAYGVTVTPLSDRGEGTVEAVHRRTEERTEFYYRIELERTPRIAVALQRSSPRFPWEPASGEPGERVLGVEDLDPETAKLLTDRFLGRVERKTIFRLKSLLERRKPVLRFLEERRIRPPRALARMVEVVWMEDLLVEMNAPAGREGVDVASWGPRLARFEALGLSRNEARLSEALAGRLLEEAKRLCREHSEEAARALIQVLEVAETLSPAPDLWETQNFIYDCALGRNPAAGGKPGPAAVPASLRQETARLLGFAETAFPAPERVEEPDRAASGAAAGRKTEEKDGSEGRS